MGKNVTGRSGLRQLLDDLFGDIVGELVGGVGVLSNFSLRRVCHMDFSHATTGHIPKAVDL